jgi:hypothetical protein
MTTDMPRRWPARTATLLALAAMLGACSKDSSTSPSIGLMITADPSTNAQMATVGTAVAKPVEVHVMNQDGEVVPGAVVTWTVISHAGTTSADTSTTDASGTATVNWTLDTLARTDSLTASIQSGASVTITATGTAGPATSATKFGGDGQTVVSGGVSAPFMLKVTDQYGNAVSGVPVAWVVTGGGTLSATSTTTDVTGMSTVTLTLGTTPGQYTIQATAAALTAVTFNLTGS